MTLAAPVVEDESEAAVTPPMPPLLLGRRRGLLALLVAAALAHASCAVGAGLLVGFLLGDVGRPTSEIAADLAVLLVVLVGLGATRYVERVVAEQLGQDYVQQLRRALIGHAMTSPSAPSLGITIARSTNDLASVRNWVSLGIAPLVALAPLAVGSLIALAVLDPVLAAVVGVPLVVLAVVLLAIAGPVSELGRTVEYRQNYKAARRIIAPLLAETVTGGEGPVLDPAASRKGRVLVSGLVVGEDRLPDLAAVPGERILFRATNPSQAREVFTRIAVPRADGAASICVDGKDLAHTGPKNRRRRVGYAPVGARLERGSVSRAVRYRRPDLDDGEAAAALAAVGLAERVARLPDGERTSLRRGGEPLTRQEIARLWVARASLGGPPLLLLEHIDDDLGSDGRTMLRGLLADYPGVVLIASDRPETLLEDWREWGPGAR